MEIVWMVAKYILAGIFIFVGATMFTKAVSGFVDRTNKKDEENEDDKC